MDSGHYAVLLLAVGLAVLVIEIFVPSGGLLAVLTLMCLTGGLIFAFQEWWGTDPAAFWLYVGSAVVLVPATVTGAFVMLPRTKLGRRLLQEPPTAEELAPMAAEGARLAALVGRRGVTLTPHSPGGMVEVEGERHHAEARGPMLDPGRPVEVVGVRGRRLVVRLADAAAPAEFVGDDPAAPGGTTIDAAPDRPGGKIDPDAPVGYARADEPPELEPRPDPPPPAAEPAGDESGIDFEIPEDERG